MKKFSLIVILMLLVRISSSFAQDEKILDDAAETAKAFQLMSLGPEHGKLKMFEGKWRQLCTQYVKDSPPVYGKGETENSFILAGKYLNFKSKYVMMDFNIENNIFLGFDRRINKFTLVVFDNQNTFPIVANGDYNESKKQFEFHFESLDLFNKNKPFPVTILFTFEKEDKYIYEVIIEQGKKTQLSLQIANIKMD
jgi:hypothetical protein